MDVLLSLFYLLFTICVVYPPTECVVAGFTIAQIFDGLMGSENVNFVSYHMRRTSITMVAHSFLPLGYFATLWLGGWRSEFVPFTFIVCIIVILLVCLKMICWWEYERLGHPVVKTLLPYVSEGSDWRVVAAEINTEFKRVDKVSIQLRSTSKFVATQTWLIKVSQYTMHVIKQNECTLVATATDSHRITENGEDEVQYINIQAIPVRDTVKGFSFRITTTALRELQPRLSRAVRVPPHVSLLPTVIERFLFVFKHCILENPEYLVPDDQEQEQCIGCMQNMADVKIQRHCLPPPPQLVGGPPECQDCNCRVVWCASCLARWWAARAARLPPSRWLMGRCTCPVCRANFCLLDVCPARFPSTPATPATS